MVYLSNIRLTHHFTTTHKGDILPHSTPVELIVVAVNAERRLAFANNPNDTGDSVLLLLSNCHLPAVIGDSLGLPGEKLISPSLPSVGQRVMCITVPGRYGKLRAQHWTTLENWENASKKFAVLCENPDDDADAVTVWEGTDLLELSIKFRSTSWSEGGVILRRPNGDEYYIVEVVRDPTTGDPHDVPVLLDPRTPIHYLSSRYYGKCLLPQD